MNHQLKEVRDEPEELSITERIARRQAEQLYAASQREAAPPVAVGQDAGRVVLLVPQRERGSGPCSS